MKCLGVDVNHNFPSSVIKDIFCGGIQNTGTSVTPSSGELQLGH